MLSDSSLVGVGFIVLVKSNSVETQLDSTSRDEIVDFLSFDCNFRCDFNQYIFLLSFFKEVIE